MDPRIRHEVVASPTMQRFGTYAQYDVARERGQITSNIKPDPIDAQWVARDKFQDERNVTRERWS